MYSTLTDEETEIQRNWRSRPAVQHSQQMIIGIEVHTLAAIVHTQSPALGFEVLCDSLAAI